MAIIYPKFGTSKLTLDNNQLGLPKIELEFVGYKFNILNEISMGHLLAAPHMYTTRFDISNANNLPSSSQSIQESSTQQNSNIPIASNSKNTIVQQIYAEKGYQKIKEMAEKLEINRTSNITHNILKSFFMQ